MRHPQHLIRGRPMRGIGTRWALLFAAALVGGCTEEAVEPTSAPGPEPAVKKTPPRIDAQSKARYFGAHQDLRERIRQAHAAGGTAGTGRAARSRNLQLLAHVPLEGLSA